MIKQTVSNARQVTQFLTASRFGRGPRHTLTARHTLSDLRPLQLVTLITRVIDSSPVRDEFFISLTVEAGRDISVYGFVLGLTSHLLAGRGVAGPPGCFGTTDKGTRASQLVPFITFIVHYLVTVGVP